MRRLFIFFIFSMLVINSFAQNVNSKIDGVSFVNPPTDFPAENMDHIKNINADWLAVIPFGFSRKNNPKVTFNSLYQWWGEKIEGTKKITSYAHNCDLKVMLKPHVWLRSGWIGEFDLQNEIDWKTWEKEYSNYILTYAKVAAETNTEMLCIATEYKIAAVKRPAYFRQLIKEIRKIYKGKLTYAANWDNYQNITFWDDLDYIGIDAYYPLSTEKTPKVKDLVNSWKHYKTEFKQFSEAFNKQILFTEFGYMSCDFTANKNWENEKNQGSLNVNMQGQSNAFEAYFKALYSESWFAGGFLWKWFNNDKNAGGLQNKDYTPQNKPVELIIKDWFE